MKTVRDKVIAVTGAGSGIGRALALELCRRGARLSLADVDAPGLQETVRLLEKPSDRVYSQRVDVGVREDVEAWAQATQAHFGQVNGIINNAGVALSGPVSGVSIEDYEWVMQVNFWGVVYGTKVFLPLLKASGDGHIVNISSVFGLSAQPLMSGYNASKYAVRGFTESLRQDLRMEGSKVSATCVFPGGVRTAIARSARIGGGFEAATGTTPRDAKVRFEARFISTPESAAQAIVGGILRDRARVLIGPDAHVLDLCVRAMPSLYQWLFTAVAKRRL